MFGIRSFNSLLNLIKRNKLYTLVLLLVIAMFGHYYFTFKGTPSYKKIKTKFNSFRPLSFKVFIKLLIIVCLSI